MRSDGTYRKLAPLNMERLGVCSRGTGLALYILYCLCHRGFGQETDCRNTLNGIDYVGNKSTTLSGFTCQRWDSQTPHKHKYNFLNSTHLAVLNVDNHCRNPSNSGGYGPWCYTTDPGVRWESCGIQMCKECLHTALGTEYDGSRQVTESGRTCQRWDSQYPHPHQYNGSSVQGADNSCRNPDMSPDGPWCLTTDPSTARESCGLGACLDCRKSLYGQDYRGHQNVTESGLSCQSWSVQTPHHPSHVEKYPLDLDHERNYCRNPDLSPTGPWCYTMDPQVFRETCSIPFCTGTTSDPASGSGELSSAGYTEATTLAPSNLTGTGTPMAGPCSGVMYIVLLSCVSCVAVCLLVALVVYICVNQQRKRNAHTEHYVALSDVRG